MARRDGARKCEHEKKTLGLGLVPANKSERKRGIFLRGVKVQDKLKKTQGPEWLKRCISFFEYTIQIEVNLNDMKVCSGSESKFSLIFNLETRWAWVVSYKIWLL